MCTRTSSCVCVFVWACSRVMVRACVCMRACESDAVFWRIVREHVVQKSCIQTGGGLNVLPGVTDQLRVCTRDLSNCIEYLCKP